MPAATQPLHIGELRVPHRHGLIQLRSIQRNRVIRPVRQRQRFFTRLPGNESADPLHPLSRQRRRLVRINHGLLPFAGTSG
jgi:hypothetical protein